MALPRNYQTIEDFEREEIRPGFRIGFSLDDIEDTAFEGELSFDESDGFELDGTDDSDEDEVEEDDDAE